MLRLHLYPNWDVCLWTSWHLCVYNSEFVFSLSSLWSGVCQSDRTRIMLPWVRGTSFTQRRSKRRRQSASRFRPLCLWHEEMGLNLMGSDFFPLRCLLSPKLWIVIITHQVNRTAPMHWLHRATVNRERVVGKGKRSWQEWLSHWWVTDEILGLRRTHRRLIILTA